MEQWNKYTYEKDTFAGKKKRMKKHFYEKITEKNINNNKNLTKHRGTALLIEQNIKLP